MTDAPSLVSRPTVAVLGCGWLGLPLARTLVEAGYRVHGSTTTPGQLLTLRDAGIRPFLLSLSPSLSVIDADTLQALLHGAEVLVLNVPPSRAAGSPEAYPALLQPVAEAATLAGVRHVLLVSSTGVYADEPRIMRESDAQAAITAEVPLLQAEALFQSEQHTVVRLAGLIGPGRSPGRFLAGRAGVPHGEAPVNLIHLQDCINLLSSIIEQELWGYTFNASAATHPTRRTFYTAAATRLGLQPPTFLEETTGGKQIDSSLIRELTGYQFRHEDVVAALEYC
ncbi:nucleoside-diphosphate-sugar epimerase [Hymenobacter luteus]|uniref:Nucleoside-diphosphate-sugar epimerase n=2 Tax=Hymenobacter TaxID=89966 RepID=A0A7W9T2N6_9BACT|nr:MULTISPECIES: NAD(P)H-binding protein [Hymenobacter]MBB4601706.1 nucleoside-diphosphate-sugar epimerase [Hymenobacter latericoloratus]MBB6059865.1 nucleoside-diphosphate-sugar epimerase [Hymenobacter luteus]